MAQTAKHVKKRENLEEVFKKFLGTLDMKKSLENATPFDVKRFLVWKDKDGKTKVHELDCKYLGKSENVDCACPMRMACGSVVNLVQNLVNIFQRAGRGKSFDEHVKDGNPALSMDVKTYIKCIKEEQAKAHILPKQAKPIFLTKLETMSEYIDNQLEREDITLKERFVLARDQALFKLQFFAGDRASDVGMTIGQEVKILDDRGLLFNHTFGKTLRGDGKCNTFILKECKEKVICPVRGITKYLNISKSMGISLGCGYLFRPISEVGNILNESLSYSAIYERLREYLSRLCIYDGETPHSFRAGCAVHMYVSKSALSTEEMKHHIGWSTDSSVRYYSRQMLINDANKVADRLAQSASSSKSAESEFNSLSKIKDLDH